MSYVFVYQEWDVLKEQTTAPNTNTEVHVQTVIERPAFSFRLQEARIKKRLTIADVADQVGVAPYQISLYENGTEVPSADINKEITRVLDL